ncbi:MAG: methyl-accepting chemotaxis protein, partial [Fretibacterium sp.]|nr:methyl-accepting chemotaxis protein [Fretibacterium sp.]
MSIKRKLMLVALIVSLAILGMTGITYYRGTAVLSDILALAGRDSAVESAKLIEEQLDELAHLTVLTAASTGYVLSGAGQDEAILESYLASALPPQKSLGITEIYFGFESNGRIVTGTGWKQSDDYDSRTRSWYTDAKAAPKGEAIFTEPYVDLATQRTVMSVAVSVFSPDNKFLGVMGCDIVLESINEMVTSSKVFNQGAGAMMIQSGPQSGLLVAHPDKDMAMKSNLITGPEFAKEVHELGRQMAAGNTGHIDYLQEGEERRAFYAPIGHGFSLCIFFPTAFVTSMIGRLSDIMLAVAAVAFLLIAGLLFAVIRGISRSMNDMNSGISELSKGNLTVQFNESGKDELSLMSHSLNNMVNSVSDVMSKIHGESENTSRQAETLAALSQETLASMEEVSASLERVQLMIHKAESAVESTASAISELSTSADSSAHSATSGADQAEKVSQATSSAVSSVESMVASIYDAGEKSEGVMKQIKELAHSVEAISGFVSTITSIADQTNLLALNAAIEAARAGEAGRGFAVVAEEVRKLAEDSANAASEVNRLITVLQQHSSSSLSATESTSAILKGIMTGAEKTESELKNSLTSLNNLSEAIQSIAAIAEEQAASTGDMTGTVSELAEVAGQIVASADSIESSTHETTKAAESIATEAQGMAETATT